MKRKSLMDKAWRKNNPEKVRDYHRRYRVKNRDKMNAARKAYREKHKDADDTRDRIYAREWKRKLRCSILDRMGGKCVRCGFANHLALQIDHINGGGGAELRAFKNHYAFYKSLRGEIDFTKYQLLCANCNAIKRMENFEHRKPNPRT